MNTQTRLLPPGVSAFARNSSGRLITLALWIGFSTFPSLHAKLTPIADTGYRLIVPENYIVSVPPGAPDILLQCDRPDGNGTIQVVRSTSGASTQATATDYETKMTGALGNLNLQKTQLRTIAQKTCELRTYQSFSGGMNIRVMALFFDGGDHAFIVHSLDTSNAPTEFEAALCSLNSSPQSGYGQVARGNSPASPTPALGNSGFKFDPPAGWQSLPSEQPNGVQYALPGQQAAIEVLWIDVDQPSPNSAALLDQTLQQLESGFGTGWTQRERVPHQKAGLNILFKRFGGDLNGTPAELLIHGVTDGQRMVLAYGYYPETVRFKIGNTMRDSMLSITRSDTPGMPGAAPPSQAHPTPPPSAPASTAITTNSGWGTPPAPITPSPTSSSGWGSPSTSTTGNTATVAPPPAPLSIPPPPATTRTVAPPPPAPTRSVAPPPSPPRSVAPPPPVTTHHRPSSGYEMLVVDDSGFEFAYPAHFTIAQRSEGQTQWFDPNADLPKVVMVVQTMMRSVGNTADSVRDGIVNQVNNSAAARLLDSSTRSLNGLSSHLIHFTLNRGSEPQHFRYAVLDLPGPHVAALSFVAPVSIDATAEQHYAELLRTVRTAPPLTPTTE